MKVRILAIGDVVGKPGRSIIVNRLGEYCRKELVDCVIANGENLAGGSGLLPVEADELFKAGVHVITGGDHIWGKKEIIPYIDKTPGLIRPANYPVDQPGKGYTIVETASGVKVGVIHLQGRVFMHTNCDCPFVVGKKILQELREKTNVIAVDMHCEATSEKVAMGWHLDGRASAVVGTHTHVQTADERVLPQGTAYITDVGMTGPHDSVIGVERSAILQRFLTGMPTRFETATENPRLNAVVIAADEHTGRAVSIERLSLSSENIEALIAQPAAAG